MLGMALCMQKALCAKQSLPSIVNGGRDVLTYTYNFNGAWIFGSYRHVGVTRTCFIESQVLSCCVLSVDILVKTQPSTQSTRPWLPTRHTIARPGPTQLMATVLATGAFLLPLHTNLLSLPLHTNLLSVPLHTNFLSQASIMHYSQSLRFYRILQKLALNETAHALTSVMSFCMFECVELEVRKIRAYLVKCECSWI